MWCLYELLALIKTKGELSLGFTASGHAMLLQMAAAFAQGRKGGAKDKMQQGVETLERAIKVSERVRTPACVCMPALPRTRLCLPCGQAVDSKNAQATVPADERMIKGMIMKQPGGHKKFDDEVREALQAAWAGYVAHAELCPAVAKLPGPSASAADRKKGHIEFLKMLQKHNQRRLPQEPIPCKVKVLDLQAAGVSDKHTWALGQVLALCALTECNLQGNNLGDKGWCALFDGLHDNTENKIAKWDLSNQSINSTIAKSLAAYVAVSGALTTLILDGFETGMPIEELQGAEPVSYLDFHGKKLTDASAIVIAKCLEFNGALTELNLRECNIGLVGSKALGEALAVNGVLIRLVLGTNNIGDAGAAALG